MQNDATVIVLHDLVIIAETEVLDDIHRIVFGRAGRQDKVQQPGILALGARQVMLTQSDLTRRREVGLSWRFHTRPTPLASRHLSKVKHFGFLRFITSNNFEA